ncbi:zinc finger protein ZPR1-like [Ctenocephalides felis]|uniref:zinc finger protein ZPR1-like n=1 Tax=Ctenocephalides felis TaxID=7515 RepID=UPI000E6E12F8|nr:zinc finger protein ZPR1-like [Ctenocephalides felis]
MSAKPLFKPLNADDIEPEITEISSLCMNCHKDGTTRLLLTKIPFYKDVVLMSFSCDYCGFENNEIQSAGEVAPRGVKIKLMVESTSDLNRTIVKSDYSSVKFVELDFEIPSQSQKAEITTIEGIINRSISGLNQDQNARRLEHPETAVQIDAFILSLEKLKLVENPFTFILEDISGNSHIENPNAPKTDPKLSVNYFVRNAEQNHVLGVFTHKEVSDDNKDNILKPIAEDDFKLEDLHGEVLTFPTNCPECNAPCETNMKMTNIPHFKDVVIMATLCEVCGHRTNEVKSGGGIEEHGMKHTVQIRGKEDFSRDVLKSETCSVEVPELELVMGSAALNGRFTTVEGLLSAMKNQIASKEFIYGDSQDSESKNKMDKFLEEFQQVLDGKKQITLILDDPAGNSYVQSFNDDGTPDEQLKVTKYDRTYEQNEDLGLNDMKTENYS